MIDVPLTGPQRDFVLSTATHPAIIGGLGCVHPDTKVWTERGLMRIADITAPIRVLSWNEKDRRFQLSLSGGAFPKGRANLIRVATQQGEFRATSHHRFFSSRRTYEPVGGSSARHRALQASPSLLRSIEEGGLSLLPVDVESLNQKLVDLMGSYADEARQCGQRLLTGEGIDPTLAPSPACARKLDHECDLCDCARTGVPHHCQQEHIHRDQFFAHSCMLDSSTQMEGLASIAARHVSSLHAERTLHCLQQELLSREMCERRHTEQECGAPSPDQNLSSFKPPVVDNQILEVSEAERNCVYYDMQVMNTNNYVDEFGFIHHNSGKSRAGTFRAIIKLLEHKGLNVGYYMPTYDLLKLRAMVGIEDDLKMLGLQFKTNLSEYTINVSGYGSIICRSYDRPERIVAYETSHSIVDEIDTLSKEKAALVWRKITERNRQKSPTPNSIGAVTTPDQGFSGFVYDRWVTRADESTELIKAPTHSNPYLPADYIDNIRRNYDPALAEMYIQGEFVSLTANKVYHYFGRTTHGSDREIKQGDRLHIGMDFNVGGCCAVTFVVDGDNPVAVDEFISHDTRDIINNIQSRYSGYDVTIYPDASGRSGRTNASASDIDILESAGYRVDAPSTNPFIRDRINAVNSMFSHNRLTVNVANCPQLTQALETQGYAVNGEPEKFNSHPAIDDWSDSLGYFVSRCYPVIRPMTAININW